MEKNENRNSKNQNNYEVKESLRLDYVAAASLLACMAVISFVNILGRYLFHYSLAFTEEVTINLFVWLTVVGSGIAFERCSHLGMVSFYKMFPPKLKKSVLVLGALLSTFLFLAVDLLLVKTIYQEMTVFKAESPALGIPVWIYYSGVILFSPFVFRGIYMGTSRQMKEIENRYKKIEVEKKTFPIKNLRMFIFETA